MLGISTPRQLAQRAELYHQLSHLLNAGIGLIDGLKMQLRSPPARRLREPIARWLRALQDGASFSDALATTPAWLPAFDQALLEAGEKSGRLPACLQLLAAHHRQSAKLTKNALADLTYPLFLFHFAVLLGPFPQLFLSGDLVAYLGQTLSILVPCYLVAFALLYAVQGERGQRWRALLEALTLYIPVFGKARRSLALARLAAALEALLSAGVSIVEAWPLAASGSGSPAIQRAVQSWGPLLQAGETPAEALARSRCFPDLFANMYQTGEISGELEQTLKRLYILYREDGERLMSLVAQWVPRIIYLVIVAMIAYRILSFYAGYFGQIEHVIP